MSSEMDCIVQDFLVESYENLDQLDQALVALEGNAHPQERLASIFRAIHTIKGTCGFLGFSQLEKLSHVGESLLSRLRDGVLSSTPVITSALLQMLDSIREILANIESTGQEGNAAYQDLVDTLNRLQNPTAEPSAITEVGSSADAVDLSFNRKPQACASPALPVENVDGNAHACGLRLNEEMPDAADTDNVCEARKSPANASVADTAIRVDVKLLDKLMVLVGELVLTRNRMQQHATQFGNSQLLNSSQRLNLITTELQEAVMKTRMQPIGSIWSKFPRVVRDVSLACRKQVSLEMDGLETELDKTLIEAVKDPLLHLVRNAIDHGIESPELRIARGKPVQGRIWLRAYHEGGQVNIDITDDGDGISPERIKAKAVERGLVTQEQTNVMSERDAIRLIFLPGFSTAENITNVSGRGVGLDVVQANIERIGGTIDVCSKPGVGTTIRIKIPLTLAIIPALMVGHDAARFAIPQANLLELVRLEGDEARSRIELVLGAPVYRLRGTLLPLLYLDRELCLQNPEASRRASAPGLAAGGTLPPSEAPRNSDVLNILVLQAEDRRFGLIVDDILDSAEIVVKPLDKRLHATRAFAGATILGDGKLALILDIVNIAKSARLLSAAQQTSVVASLRDAHLSSSHGSFQVQGPESRRDSATVLLVFQAGDGSRMAIPLSSVTRLEEIPSDQIERAGRERFVQYRGQILPLVDAAKLLGGTSCDAFRSDEPSAVRQVVPVVVCTGNDKPCGLIVERILDIVEQEITVRGKATRSGIDYTAVVQGRLTEIVEIATLLRTIDLHQTFDLAT